MAAQPACVGARRDRLALQIQRVHAAEIGVRRIEVAHQLEITVAEVLAADARRDHVGADGAEIGQLAAVVQAPLPAQAFIQRGAGIAVRTLTMASGIRAAARKRRCRSNTVWSSVSKPTIMPHQTSMPTSWMRRTLSSRVPCLSDRF